MRIPSPRRKRAFDELQSRLEAQFDPGDRAPPGIDDIETCPWRLGHLTVKHNYYYRSGLHEQVLISHNESPRVS